MGPHIVLQARVDDGTIRVAEGRADTPDLVIEAGPALRSLLARELTPRAALRQGLVRVEGPPKMLDTFAQMFYIPSQRETAQA